MTPALLLVDSNVYLRLACHVPQFFGGHPHYDLRTVAGVDDEFRSRRLRSKFLWPSLAPYPAQRLQWQLKVSKAQASSIKASRPTVREFAEDLLAEAMPRRQKLDGSGTPLPFLSPVDLSLLCHAVEFECGLLTDELPLTKVCIGLEIPTRTSMSLLRYFLDQGIVDMLKIEAVVLFWQQDDDVPNRRWTRDYESLFGRQPPRMLRES
jgi:hypothetical protein